NALAAIRSGEVDLVVGTQAVIQQDVEFERLGLAVIDEQHKFGVAQRARFSTGHGSPHVLVMTATPIPRSLCLTQFGDLDVTVIRDMPPGRQKVVTSRVRGPRTRAKAWDFIRRQLAAGRQAFVVCPRIEGTDAEAETPFVASAEQVYQRLVAEELQGFRVGLAHGQMDAGAKTTAMDAFRHGELDALVATTVVEVGVDVPNATIMAVIEAEHFGLSQLHQLRGRIGRGKFPGYCFLFSETDTPEADRRLQALVDSENGFEIAEVDFQLRGPGDVLGTRQHGEMPLRVANIHRDQQILGEARTAAFALVESGRFDEPECVPLKVRVLDRFAQVMDLPQSG
ncbi:MAG: helicase-related protein, partial [Planctomycetaceae bacterium]